MYRQTLPGTLHETTESPRQVPYKRIAAEEAWCPPELLQIYQKMVETKALDDPGFNTMFGFYLSSPSARTQQIRE
jgi:5-carboxyvanillate decarboxylase